ncbi:MAG: HTTM domain-containing protein [Rhizobiaceae bacterium]|nr:HTTM domain-containing protein [Rhizobiaceae bacterium]
MNIDEAMRLTEIMLGLAFIQQSVEHLHRPNDEKILFIPRIILSLLLIIGFQVAWVLIALVGVSLMILKRFSGPYNGGSDRMGLLILVCLTLAHLAPSHLWQEIAFGYLAMQLILSYLISGWVKIVNPAWRSGRALQDVFAFTTYPVSENLRGFAEQPKLLFVMSWCVIAFELLFPLALLNTNILVVALIIAATFHLANAFLFGLNRFFWIWLTAYPSIIWFQGNYIP